MNLPLISQLPQDMATAVLIVLLVVVFIVGFKVMKMVFETITVSAVSGVFYLALSFVMDYSFSINQMLTYAFLGATLYLSYSFMASAYGIARSLLEIPYHIILLLLKPVKYLYREGRKKYRLWRIQQGKQKTPDDDEEDDSSTKQVIIDKVTDDDEE